MKEEQRDCFSESNDKDNMYQEATGLGTVMM